LEFLKALAALSSDNGGGVHYGAVADRLNVSKWTGYDMMQELIADGLVRSSYSTASSGFRGRSQVLFEPTPAGLRLLAESDSADPPVADQTWRETMVSILDRAKAAAKSGSDPRDLLNHSDDKTPLAFCAGMLAFLIVEFRRRGLSLTVIEALLGAGIEAGSMLSLLIGLLTGELLVRGALKVISNPSQRITRFAEEVSKMGDQTKALLAEFVRSVIDVTVTA